MNGACKLSGVRGLPIGSSNDGGAIRALSKTVSGAKDGIHVGKRLGGVAAGSKKADKKSGQFVPTCCK